MWYLLEDQEKQLIIELDKYPDFTVQGHRYSSIRPAKTREELFSECGIPEKLCVCCGRYINSNYTNKAALISRNMCFYCNLWTERAENITENNMIVNHQWYTVAEENSSYSFRGFGGAQFKFLKDGREIVSTNVWFGGEIPERFWTKIPDNATLVKS